jgi:hypothetical protein
MWVKRGHDASAHPGINREDSMTLDRRNMPAAHGLRDAADMTQETATEAS